jgi:hypothetical protein
MQHCKISHSNLGPTETTFFHTSAQTADQWVNSIYHNSPYAIFHLNNGKLSLTSKHHTMPKFRKCKCVDESTALTKINAYYDKLN